MGCFSLTKTPGKASGWKRAEHWITTCCEMGYAADLVFPHHFVPGPSVEANIIMPERKGETQPFILTHGHLINSLDVTYFVRAVQVAIENISRPNS